MPILLDKNPLNTMIVFKNNLGASLAEKAWVGIVVRILLELTQKSQLTLTNKKIEKQY